MSAVRAGAPPGLLRRHAVDEHLSAYHSAAITRPRRRPRPTRSRVGKVAQQARGELLGLGVEFDAGVVEFSA
jgi:hypothetical protein